MAQLVDGFGRVHRDLRISLTDKCSLRCTYCMPAEGLEWIGGEKILTRAEIARVAAVAVSLGVTEFRLTGGEPLLRPDVVGIVEDLVTIPGNPQVSLTTNGIRLPALAAPLADAGLSRINISLDTLIRERFVELTRRDRLVEVMAGIAAAQAAGLEPIKVNSVLMRGVNDDEAVPLLTWALGEGISLRFIEQMPLDAGHIWNRAAMVTAEEILGALSAVYSLEPVATRGSAPAEEWLVNGGPATVGVIASVTRPFCGACDRVRLTADGQFRTCLFAREEDDLRAVLRSGGSDADIATVMVRAIAGKKAGHGIDEPGFLQPDRPMSAIGG